MANIRSCNKHNMIACVEKTAQNADFYQIIDFLTGCSINYSLLVDPDLIGPWLQQFWATATLKVINDVPHIRAKGCKFSKGCSRQYNSMLLLLLKVHAHSTKCCSFYIVQRLYNVYCSFHDTVNSQGTAELQRTADFQGTAEPHDAASIPKSPNDYTPTDVFQTSGGDEGLLDIYALNREVRRLKKQTLSQAKQILKLKAKLKKLSKFVKPVVKYHALWLENQNLKKQKRRSKRHKKKESSVKLGRNQDKGILSEEHKVQEEDLAHPFFDDTADQDAAVTPDLERKSDETEEVNIEGERSSNVKSGAQKNWDLQAQLVKLKFRTLNEQHNALKFLSLFLVQESLGKTTIDEEVARKFKAGVEWDAEEERKRERMGIREVREAKKTLKEKKASYLMNKPSKKPKVKNRNNDESEIIIRV
ncbi:hypothetical protein Tco_1517121 [Tanacetum coccineum]